MFNKIVKKALHMHFLAFELDFACQKRFCQLHVHLQLKSLTWIFAPNQKIAMFPIHSLMEPGSLLKQIQLDFD